MRATVGQYLCARTHGAGKAATSRLYACGQDSAVTAADVCGAFTSGLSSFDHWPRSIFAISSRMDRSVSTKRSSSAYDSLSVGSIISVPATGNDIVGAWNP
jgi:hypothetical protein